MASKLFKIHLTNRKEKMRDILRENEHALSMEIVYKICEAIDKDELFVDIAQIVTPMEIVTIHSTSPNYLTTLKTNLDTLIKYEEYELCALAKKHIDYLVETNDPKYLEEQFYIFIFALVLKHMGMPGIDPQFGGNITRRQSMNVFKYLQKNKRRK